MKEFIFEYKINIRIKKSTDVWVLKCFRHAHIRRSYFIIFVVGHIAFSIKNALLSDITCIFLFIVVLY